MAQLLLGVDVGSTAAKAAVYDLEGRELGRASRTIGRDQPAAGQMERSLDDMWTVCCEVMQEVIAAVGRPKDIAAVGVTGAGDGLHILREDGTPARPAVLALDKRAQSIVQTWRATHVGMTALRLTGELPFAGSPAALLRWLREHEPGTYRETRWLLFAKDWITFKLTDVMGTDITDISSGLSSLRPGGDPGEILALYDLADISRVFPEVRPSEAIVGVVTEQAARQTGLLRGTPTVAGLHDIDANSLGSGCASPGQLCVVMGTFGSNLLTTNQPYVDSRWMTRTHFKRDAWMILRTSGASMACLRWFLDATAHEGDYEWRTVLDAGTTETLPIFLPYVFESDADQTAAGGSFIGLKSHHCYSDLIRAVIEGVVINQSLDVDMLRAAVPVSEIRITGGGANSAMVCQLFADLLATPVDIPKAAESGTLGAALCAGVGIGAIGDWDHAAAAVSLKGRVQPSPDGIARAKVRAERFVHARSALCDLTTR